MSTIDFEENAVKSSTHRNGDSGNDVGAGVLICKKCEQPLEDEFLICSECAQYFHKVCISDLITENWKCNSCKDKSNDLENPTEKICSQCKLRCKENYQLCLKCKKVFHKECISVEELSAADLWICHFCERPETKPKSTTGRSHKTISSRRSSRLSENLDLLNEESKLIEEMSKKKSEMLRLEEELLSKKKALILEEENQRRTILQKKQRLLDTGSSSSTSSVSSLSSAAKTRNTKDWVNNLSTNKNNTDKVDLDPKAKPFLPVKQQPNLPPNFNLQGLARDPTPHIQPPLIPLVQNATYNIPPPTIAQNRHLSKHHIQARRATKDLDFFSGDSLQWPMFIGGYEDTTRECNFSLYENQMRLKTSLKGEALARVGAMLAHPQNVPMVIDRLRKMYGQPHQIIEALTKKIRAVPKVRLDKLQSLVDLQSAVMQLCSNIFASSITEHLMNPSLIMEIVEKLPAELRLQWGERVEEIGHANLEILNEWLSFKADSACRVMFDSSSNTDPEKESRPKKSNFVLTHSQVDSKCIRCKGACKKLVKCEVFNEDPVSERWTFAKAKHLCFRCLEPHRLCRDQSICGVSGCTQKHHPLLHESKNPEETIATISREHESILYRIIPVKLYGSQGEISTFAFLDEGSSISLVDENLLQQINPTSNVQPLCMFWTDEKRHMEYESKAATIGISGLRGNKIFSINIRSKKVLNLPCQTLTEDFLHNDENFNRLPILPYSKASPKILIGMDNWKLSIARKIKESSSCKGVAATSTLLGWVVQGRRDDSNTEQDNYNEHVHLCDCNLDDLMEKQFSLENHGVLYKNERQLSSDDKCALKMLNAQTTFENGSYTTGLLWRPAEFKIPNSRLVAEDRMFCLERRMCKNPDLKSKMANEIDSYRRKNYIRRLTEEELDTEFKRKWYLPIFPVFNKNKPDKFRMVWDAAAETNGLSLNKMQFKGPDLVPLLIGVLLRFRQGKYGVSADIAEMFHMIKINREDQHCQRFLWRESPDCPMEEYVMQVMTFGSCSSPCTAQFIKNKNAEKFENDNSEAVEAIIRDHYVDDFLGSYDDEIKALQLCQDVAKIHKAGGFYIRNWVSNSMKILQEMSSSSEVKGLDIQGDVLFKEKILGMWWIPEKDVFTFKLRKDDTTCDILDGKRCPTKRELLSILMKIYDPLGLINNFLIFAKILLQKAWLAEIDWDVAIGEELFAMWLKWLAVLQTIDELQIPRWHFDGRSSPHIELHIFCDASKDAYSAVGYFRIKAGEKFKCSLVMSKSRVAPKQIISIPRLELMAAVLGVRLAEMIQKEHSIKIDRTVYWSDSKSVVYWIRDRSKSFKQFVAFRISEIREKSHPDMWRYVPGRKNVADLSTKWSRVPKLKFDSLWFQGPNFLQEAEEFWESETVEDMTDSGEFCCLINSEKPLPPLAFKIDPWRFSKWRKLIGAVAYVLRVFVPNELKPSSKFLLEDELEKAKKIVIRQAQAETYSKEIAKLNDGNMIDGDSKIAFLSPYIDDEGTLRAYGRLDYGEGLSSEVKRPAILPHNHRLTFLLVDHYHRFYEHVHDNTVVNEINQLVYVHKLRIVVRTVRSRCQFCKNKNARPIAPLMADLPPARLQTFTRAFSFVGLDYFGPMVISIGHHLQKRWGVLLTCLTTRGIHIELAESLSADSCIMALQRFISRRGIPKEIYSDNATNFRGSEKELLEQLKILKNEQLVGRLQSCKWFFIPPKSPHMGGSWERMVRSVKNVLYQILPPHQPSYELLSTILIHIENMVNSRPLCYVPVDHDTRETLTPNHFLLGSSNGIKPSGHFSDAKEILRSNWMEAERQADFCWRRFVKEFLPELTGRSKWVIKSKPIKVGDMVLLIDEKNPRNTYPKGIVIEVYMGKNDQVRSARIQTQTGIFKRPAVKIAVLDVKDDGTKDLQDLPTVGTVDF